MITTTRTPPGRLLSRHATVLGLRTCEISEAASFCENCSCTRPLVKRNADNLLQITSCISRIGKVRLTTYQLFSHCSLSVRVDCWLLQFALSSKVVVRSNSCAPCAADSLRFYSRLVHGSVRACNPDNTLASSHKLDCKSIETRESRSEASCGELQRLQGLTGTNLSAAAQKAAKYETCERRAEPPALCATRLMALHRSWKEIL